MCLAGIQMKIAQLTRPDECDLFYKRTSDNDCESQRLAHLDADSGEGDRKSSESPESDTSSP